MKSEIAGHKKAGTEASAIRDPKTNELIVKPEDIKKRKLQYCVENLKVNEPHEDVAEVVNTRK